MPLFEIAFLASPTKKQSEAGEFEKLVVGPVFKVARDGQSAAMQAAIENGEKISAIDPNLLTVLVRPFA